MRVGIYRVVGPVSRSVQGAELVVEIELDQWTEDEESLLRKYGGDFIQLLEEQE